MFAPAAHGAIIPQTTSPFWTMLLLVRLGRERVTRGQTFGMIVCMVGVVLVVRPERLATSAGASVLLGDLLFLLCGVAWGIQVYLAKVAMHRLSAVATVAFGTGIGTAFLVPVALAERPWSALLAAHVGVWVAVGYLALVGTVFSFVWWNLAIRRVGAGRTAVFSNLVPVFGVLLSWLVLGERQTLVQLVGGVLAVVGVLVCQGPVTQTALLRSISAVKDDLNWLARILVLIVTVHINLKLTAIFYNLLPALLKGDCHEVPVRRTDIIP